MAVHPLRAPGGAWSSVEQTCCLRISRAIGRLEAMATVGTVQ
ncbi:TPA: hypothetical protein N0F65_010447 [Lagenidium giganteum]|uniref:Uncharacterized protein n=1 Tax=Lagenidium giganteum TaxID=4803 RepID=A0AAV2YX21_9STRA|nr:TPA: hypothetical protein N0F65_010447 [Lagenidium giganteum]